MISCNQVNDRETVVSFKGINRLNNGISGDLVNKVTESLKCNNMLLYLDLSDIHFIDSSGFDSLVRIQGAAIDKNTDVKLCNLSDEVLELFELMNLEDQFSFDSFSFDSILNGAEIHEF